MNTLAADLDHVLLHTDGLWEAVRDQRIFITGGTGFFGRWLLESFVWANEKLQLGAEAVVLTRDPVAFERKAPHLAAASMLKLYRGDVGSFVFPDGRFSHVLHAATETTVAEVPFDPMAMFDQNVAGTRRVLEFAKSCGARKFLFTSSGAVYGTQPSDLGNVSEDYSGAPSPLDKNTAYGQSKRVSEFLCCAAARDGDLDVTVARCFAFAGPGLPLNANFAIGNFISDALRGGPIAVNGDGTPLRSYLYAADLVIWLWTILFRGRSGQAYNVGSDVAVSIAQLARLVAEIIDPHAGVVIARKPDPSQPLQRYVPSIDRARGELGLEPHFDLRESIRRTAEWIRGSDNQDQDNQVS